MNPIHGPEDLRKLSVSDLELLAQEVRQIILATCMRNGGHLGASLGTVELAIALHTSFDSPREPIVWDVGHQAYAHKLLTGRWERFSTLRLPGGLSGFLSREESPHDAFGAGHSSTALSAALAMAWGARIETKGKQQTPWTVAVVGDGGLTAGLAFEALNNVREVSPGPFLLVLNDNQMSISRNSGAVPAILAGDKASAFFEMFGFEYWGPADGHDISSLLNVLKEIRKTDGARPIVLHAITQKGKGYAPAEELPATYHGISGISPASGKAPEPKGQAKGPRQKSYSEVVGETMMELAGRDSRIVAITAAMKEGTGLAGFAESFPERFFDVGIAEAHAVTFAAGLATRGFKPVVCIYSTFLQRALDSIIHDVALQNLDVTIAIDRAGVVGADGPTHHGAFDLAYLGMIPNFRVSAPSCLSDLRQILDRATRSGGPWAIRYPRGGGPETLGTTISEDGLRWHRDAAAAELIVVALGSCAIRAQEAVSELDPDEKRITLISTTEAKPISSSLISYLRSRSNIALMTVEEGSIRGGFGQALLKELSGRSGAWELAGYGDRFIPHGTPAGLEDAEGLSGRGLVDRIQGLLCSGTS